MTKCVMCTDPAVFRVYPVRKWRPRWYLRWAYGYVLCERHATDMIGAAPVVGVEHA